MLPRSARLSASLDIDLVIKTGRSTSVPGLKLKYLLSQPDQPSRICIVASKKQFHNAVDRNRIRRRLAPLVLPHVKSGYYYVLFVYAQTADLSASQLQSTINKLFTNLP